ncbi:MAG: pyridoxamine 5'-phosphate oxidase family protein [Acidimicrobiia bacterium]
MSKPRAERPYMPDYGVDTPDWQPLPWSWAAERLLAARNLWVVTVSGAGRPHALPLWGVWDDDDLRFGFSCGPRSRKIRNLDANPQAVIMTESTVECVSVEGRAARIGDRARQHQWVERYLVKYGAMAPGLTAEFIRQNVLVEFTPERAFAVIETEEEFSTRATRWVFGQS